MGTEITAAAVRDLREMTGSPMMDCKKALVDAGGDAEKAKEILRKKGLQTADKKAGRATAEGLIGIYQHHDGKKAVLVEINCETDFVARNDALKAFAGDVAMHVLALRPDYVSREEVPEEAREKEEKFILESEDMQSKPEAARPKILEGRMRKFYEQCCLLDQPFVKDDSKTVGQILKELIGSLGENIQIRRFARIEIGG